MDPLTSTSCVHFDPLLGLLCLLEREVTWLGRRGWGRMQEWQFALQGVPANVPLVVLELGAVQLYPGERLPPLV